MKIPEPKKLPSGNYNINLRLGGQNISITRASATECRREAALIKAQYLAGEKRIRNVRTLDKAVEAYIKSRANVLSPSTIRGYKIIQRNRFVNLHDVELKKIDWQQAVNAEAALCGAKTLHNAWGLVASVLRAEGLPVPSVSLPQVVKHEHEWLDPDEIKVFCRALEGEDIEIPALLALHGLRRSEVLALTWAHIDIKRQTITVSGSVVTAEDNKFVFKDTNKNVSSARTVPIFIPRLAELLKSADKSQPLINIYPDELRRKVNRICAVNGLPEVGAHGLRHSFASLAWACGLSAPECQKLGGWADYQTMVKIYTHLSDAAQEKAAAKLSAFFAD